MATQETPAAVSETLLAAQERLLALRKAHQATTGTRHPRTPQRNNGRSPIPTPPPLPDTIANLPPHLGWENPRPHRTATSNYERPTANDDSP
ncbi:MAG: hypothetical protein R3C44_23410 [Chloroflexota bacterium]